MSMRMASFLAGFGGGYLKANRQTAEDERQAKIDARAEKEFSRKEAEWKDADQLKADLKDAANTASIEQGAGGMVKPAEMDNRDVGLAENASLPNGGLMQGQFKVGNQTYAEKSQAEKAVSDQNAPDAVAQRMAAAYRKNGQMEKAIGMENAVMDSKLKKLGLSTAEAKFADDEFNRTLMKGIDAHPDWTVGAAKILTDTQIGGLSGLTVSARPSKDGKTVDFVGVDKDGAEKALKSFKSGADGKAEFLQSAGRASFESKLNFVVEKARADQAQSNWQQTFDFNKKKEESDQQYKSRVLGFQASQEARAAETHKRAMEDAKIPPAVKLQAGTLSDEMKSISAAMNKAMAEGSFDPNSANAKALIERQAALGIKYRQLLDPHTPGAKGGQTSDPLGFDKQEHVKTPAPDKPVQTVQASQVKAAPMVSMQQVTQPKPEPTVMDALNPGGNPSLAATLQPKAQAIESLASQLKHAQASMAQVAKGNPTAAIAQAQSVQAIRDAINKQLEGMNQQQASLVIRAAGL
jgi:hypothetical protein